MASNIDYVSGQVVPNLVEVGTGTAGEVTFYASMPTDIVVDVEGYTSVAAAGLYTALSNPVRICDTRAGNPSTLDSPPVNQCNGANNAGETLAAGGTKDIQVTGISGIPAGATAAVLNVTVANPAAPGYLTAYPQGGTAPTASNLDYLAGQVTANRVIVPLSAGGLFTVYSSARADVVVDVSGYYASGSGHGVQRRADASTHLRHQAEQSVQSLGEQQPVQWRTPQPGAVSHRERVKPGGRSVHRPSRCGESDRGVPFGSHVPHRLPQFVAVPSGLRSR